MDRDQMLIILHDLNLGAELIALQDVLFCTYVTSKGILSEELFDWPYYKLKNIDCDKLLEVREKIKQKTLTFEDLGNTELKKLYSSKLGKSLDSLHIFFQHIDNIHLCNDGNLYVFVDDDDVAFFFETYSAFEKALEERLIANILWEDMSDDELAEWVEKATHEELTFQFSEFEE